MTQAPNQNGSGRLPDVPKLKEKSSISPSQFEALKGCVLKSVFSPEPDFVKLMPYPNTVMGSLVHELLEKNGKGLLGKKTRGTLEEEWGRIVAIKKNKLAASWVNKQLIPLEDTVLEYTTKKLSAFGRCRNNPSLGPQGEGGRGSTPEGFEKWLETDDGIVKGIIDAILKREDGYVIEDYKCVKSEGLYEEHEGGAPSIKNAYKNQLKLYAALFYDNHGEWPKELKLTPTYQGDSVVIDYSENEALTLLNEAKTLLAQVNEKVNDVTGGNCDNLDTLASPSGENCKFCEYRHICNPYWKTRNTSPEQEWPADLKGELINQEITRNGDKNVKLNTSGAEVIISKIDPDEDRHPALAQAQPGDTLYCMDLKPAKDTNTRFEQHRQLHTKFSKTVFFLRPSKAGNPSD